MSMRRSRSATCYMCDSPATSREHAPPSCIFPGASALRRDLRRNLITVPSCDQHNSQKSKDDEFLRAFLILHAAPTSAAARYEFNGKLLRANVRRPDAHQAFFTDLGTLYSGKMQMLKLDRVRLDACIDRLARALFYSAFGEKWALPIRVVSPNFYSGSEADQAVPHAETVEMVEALRCDLAASPVLGENPEVFQCRLRYDDAERVFLLAARFYKSFEVYTFSDMQMDGEKKGRQPA